MSVRHLERPLRYDGINPPTMEPRCRCPDGHHPGHTHAAPAEPVAAHVVPPLRDDHLAAIREREAKATLGPWTYEVNDRASTGSAHFAVKTAYAHPKHPHSPRYVTFMCGGLGESRYLRQPKPDDYREDAETEADTNFIAHAREDIPALVAEVDRLRALVRSLGGLP